MPVRTVTRSEYLRTPETICLSCARSWPQYCAYWRLKDAEKGLEKMGATAVKAVMGRNTGRAWNKIEVYKVVECPHFKKQKEEITSG